MQNHSKSNKLIKFQHFTNQLFGSVHTKSFVNSVSNMNVVQRKKHSHLMTPAEKF